MLRKSLMYFGPIFLMHLNNRIRDCCFPESGILNPGLWKRNTAQGSRNPNKDWIRKAILTVKTRILFFFFICEFGNASKATSCVRCNINIGQPHFQEFEVAILFLVPCLSG